MTPALLMVLAVAGVSVVALVSVAVATVARLVARVMVEWSENEMIVVAVRAAVENGKDVKIKFGTE